jgi:hypothetical protein
VYNCARLWKRPKHERDEDHKKKNQLMVLF